MADAQIKFSDFETLLDKHELLLIEKKDAVLKFVRTEHKSKDTKERLKQLHKAEANLNEIAGLLFKLKAFPEFQEAAGKLCGRCKEQEIYIRDMDKRLTDDLAEQNRAEDKRSMDLVKNVTFFFAVPTGLVAGVKNGFGTGIVTPYEAGGAGFVISIAVLSRKKLTGTFKSLGKALLETPQNIRHSYTLFHLRETIKEKRNGVVSLLRGRNRQIKAEP